MSAYRAASRRSDGGGDFGSTQQQRRAGSATTTRSGGLSRNGTNIMSPAKDAVVISDKELRNILSLTSGRTGFAATQSIPVNSAYVQSGGSVIGSSSILTPQQQLVQLKMASTYQQQQPTSSMRATSAEAASKAQARKEKMLRLEREKSLRPAALTASEFEDSVGRAKILGAAKLAMDEEMDDVKHMNQMMLYAQCVTIRDAQILEKQRIADQLMEEEKRIDYAMEVDRVRTLKLHAERDAARAEEQRQGASVIITQIHEREQERLRQQEAREQEATAMLARVQALERAEEAERLAKVVAGRKLLEQVTEANNAQARSKLLKKQEEIEEEMRIQEYIRSKEARDAANEAELRRVRQEKEKEHARLLAMQERAQDRQSAIDELRAKRYQEAKDREWRQAQIETAGRRDAMKRDIALAREAQRSEKSRRISEQALQERDEYMRVLDWQNAQTASDQQKHMSAAQAAAAHRDAIRQQMEAKEREKEEARKRYLAEGQIFARQNERDKQKLMQIKQEKLALMEQMGVPHKYRAELAKKKMLVDKIF